MVLDDMSQALQRTVETEQRLRQQIEAELGIVRRKLQTEIETNVTLQKELNQIKSSNNNKIAWLLLFIKRFACKR